jgi:hypothetical protein
MHPFINPFVFILCALFRKQFTLCKSASSYELQRSPILVAQYLRLVASLLYTRDDKPHISVSKSEL